MSAGGHLHVHRGCCKSCFSSILQATQQKKAARLLVVEKLHRDLSAKYDASRAEAARLQVAPRVAVHAVVAFSSESVTSFRVLTK
jgi:hypothetical protein